MIPTNGGEVCVLAGLPRPGSTTNAAATSTRLSPAARRGRARRPGLAAAAATDRSRVPRGARHLRRPPGPGWVLVGDAGYFKDPLTAHGITDALRDAEFLVRAVVNGALPEYEAARDRLSTPLFEVAELITAYDWDTPRIRQLLRAESAAMRPEIAALHALDTPTLREAA